MAATDDFSTYGNGLDTPYTSGEAVTPHDVNELTKMTRALFVGGAGALAVVTSAGTALTLTGVTAGSVLRLRVKQVKSTGTTATNIVALW